MLDRMRPRQLMEWRAYLEGLGESDDQQNAATIAAAIANEVRELRNVVMAFMVRDSRPQKPIRPDQYIRRWRPEKKKQPTVRSTEYLYKLFKSRG